MQMRFNFSFLESVLATTWQLTCCSVTFNILAISALSVDDRYFLSSNIFSNSKICRPVNVVLTFFRFLSSSSSSPNWSELMDALLSLLESDEGPKLSFFLFAHFILWPISSNWDNIISNNFQWIYVICSLESNFMKNINLNYTFTFQ